MLDQDLATLYGVPTKVLNQAVVRNLARFPPDFMFQLTEAEFECLRSKIVTSKKVGRGGRRNLPKAFSEQGVAMLSSILGKGLSASKFIAKLDYLARTFLTPYSFSCSFVLPVVFDQHIAKKN